MERDEITPYGTSGRDGDRGAGGKVRRPPPRRPPATPYARPPEAAQRRWISKLVDPAYRLIAGGATRIFPSFFSRTASASAIAGHACDGEDQGKWQTGEEGYRDDGDKCDEHLETSKSTETESTGDISDKLRCSSGFVLHKQDEKGEQSENNKLSEIEQLVKEKKFTRDEVSRLMEIINSKAGDLPTIQQGKENASLTVRNDDKGLAVARDGPKLSGELRNGEFNGPTWGSSTPLNQSKVRDDIGASPIDIAKAYMDSCVSEAGPSSKGRVHTVESGVLRGNEAAIKPYVPSPSPKSVACWPGAVVQDSYVTPQSQRSRYGLYNFPRTPYSRTILSKSKSRSIHMQSDYNCISSTPPHQSQTTSYLQYKSRDDTLEGGYGSIGPICRTRHKFGAQLSPRRPAYTPSSNGPSQKESSDVHEGFLPLVTQSLQPGGTSYTHKFKSIDDNKQQGTGVGVPTVHMHTSLMARKILEHIDRNPPTPKEKSAELKLATKWKNPGSSSDVNTDMSNGSNGFLKLKDVDGLDGKQSILRNGYQGNSHVGRAISDKSINVNNVTPSASGMNAGSSFLRIGNDASTMQNPNGSQNFPIKSTAEDALKIVPSGGHPGVKIQDKMSLFNSSVSKPVLPSISINKPDSKWTFASDKSSGFTFPVSASTSVFSEPPTPSITPSFSPGVQHQSQESYNEPSYSFGQKRSSPPLVFSFPSTSSTTIQNDAGDIKFSFGSNEKARLSFSSFGKNAVCY